MLVAPHFSDCLGHGSPSPAGPLTLKLTRTAAVTVNVSHSGSDDEAVMDSVKDRSCHCSCVIRRWTGQHRAASGCVRSQQDWCKAVFIHSRAGARLLQCCRRQLKAAHH